MPPRGARKAAGIETNKRELGDDHELLSTRRQSKRIKSAEQLRSTPSSPQPKSRRVQVKREARYLQEETTKAENPTLLNTEELTEVKSEVSVKVNEEEIKEQTSATKATRKRRSTKKEEAEMTPLRVRTQGLRMFVGAHVSAAGGVFNAVNNSKHVGGNAFALFLKSQRKWDNPPLQDEHRDNFVKLCKEHDYDAAKQQLPHSFTANASSPGSTNKTPLSSALARLAKALTNALAATSNVVPVLETMCGHGSTIGGSLSEFRDLLALIPKEYHSRIGVCIDTCHSFAAGYDLVSPAGFQAFLKEFEDLIGIQHLRALHLNDSKAPGGSKRDLHANIGTGFLGLRAFHNVMNEPRFEGLPMILETPIDRIPAAATNRAKQEAAEEDVESGASDDEIKPKTKKKQQKKPAAAKAVPDYSIWAREIALLESLIGMDPESDEFRALEAELSEEGRETREKHMEQYLRKQETEEKKKAKSGGKQKTLIGMMNGSKGRGKSTTKKGYETESEDEGCQSC
ncbi:hypothetical protein AN3947.2 [Aspergillus nidulans FGSC A4]|nr:hypothetical protein AN3947.2 [Aspergillus nidulans FGSC A4]|eukprot:XP_661551.1 hypothetical protein AN3947.2 [Aspergillus nidulans FGSC A4]